MSQPFYFVFSAFVFLPVVLGVYLRIGSESAMTVALVLLGSYCWISKTGARVWHNFHFLPIVYLCYQATRSYFATGGWMLGHLELARLAMATGIIMWLWQSDVKLETVAKIATVVLIIECGLAFFDLGTWSKHNESVFVGTIGASNKFAYIILFLIPFPFYVLQFKRWRKRAIAAILLSAVAIVGASSRAGCAVAFLEYVACGCYFSRGIKGKRRLLVVGCFLIFAGIGAMFMPLNKSLDDYNPFGQISIWGRNQCGFPEVSREMFMKNPYFGAGPGTWGYYADKAKTRYYHPHNEFGQSLAENGIIGTAFFVFLMTAATVACFRKSFYLGVAFAATIITSFVFGMRTPEHTFYIATAIGLAGQVRRNQCLVKIAR